MRRIDLITVYNITQGTLTDLRHLQKFREADLKDLNDLCMFPPYSDRRGFSHGVMRVPGLVNPFYVLWSGTICVISVHVSERLSVGFNLCISVLVHIFQPTGLYDLSQTDHGLLCTIGVVFHPGISPRVPAHSETAVAAADSQVHSVRFRHFSSP